MAGMDARNSGWVWNLLKHNLVAVLVPEIRGRKYGSGPEFQTLFSALLSSRLGPCHTMHLGTVLNHVNGLHVNKVTARPSAHHDGSEVHPDVIVQGKMVRGGVVTERTIGDVHFNRGGSVVHDVSSLGHHPCHGGRVDDIV